MVAGFSSTVLLFGLSQPAIFYTIYVDSGNLFHDARFFRRIHPSTLPSDTFIVEADSLSHLHGGSIQCIFGRRASHFLLFGHTNGQTRLSSCCPGAADLICGLKACNSPGRGSGVFPVRPKARELLLMDSSLQRSGCPTNFRLFAEKANARHGKPLGTGPKDESRICFVFKSGQVS